MNSILFDEFVNVKAGEAYRLFPFGKIVKNGKVREITPEFAATIKLPHFKPAIKLGSHEDVTPAGGHIVALEVRADGLYAIPEFNDKGAQAISDGAYKYHSPEIIWEGGLENPSGGVISAPLIMGDALLHAPHLGEAAALYSVEVIEPHKENNSMENVTVPASLWEKFTAFIDSRLNPPEPEKVVEPVIPDEYKTAVVERDELKARIEKQEAEAARASRLEKYTVEVKATKANTDMAELLADLPEEKAEAIMKEFRALSEQITVSIESEVGSPADGGNIEDPKAAFNAVVLGIVKEKGINYNAAMEQAKQTHADLFLSWAAKK